MNAIASAAGARRRPSSNQRFPVATWFAVSRERRALRSMSRQQLEDIGLTPEQALAEARRPFWDVTGR